MGFGDAETPPEALSHYPGFLLNWVGAKSRACFGEALADVELTVPQFGVLSLIDAEPGKTQHGLVHETGIDASSMVSTLDALEQAGLVERRLDAVDRRVRRIHITKAGSKRLTAARKRAAVVMRDVFGVLSTKEQAELVRLLRKLAGC